LLKPFDGEELSAALREATAESLQQRQRQFLAQGLDAKYLAAQEENKRLRALLAEQAPDERKIHREEIQPENRQRRQEDYLQFFDTKGSAVAVAVGSILFCEAHKNYVLLYRQNASAPLRIRATLTDIERRLLPFGFIRTHRSYIARVPLALDFSNGALLLEDGFRVPVSERYFSAVATAFAEKFSTP
jgi:DNA-binding LytR/AlgR family response regulator